MNLKLLILAIILVILAATLLMFGLSNSAVKTYDVKSLLNAKSLEETEIEGLFQGFLYQYDEKTEEAWISDDNPYTKQNAESIEVLISENTQKPQLYLGANIFVYGVYNVKNKTIIANKIEASCPSKEMDKLPN